MALHFVSTTILSSSDGIDFNEEKHQETEETKAARLKGIGIDRTGLYAVCTIHYTGTPVHIITLS